MNPFERKNHPIIDWQQVQTNLDMGKSKFIPFSMRRLNRMCSDFQKENLFERAWEQGDWDADTRIMHIRRAALEDYTLPYPITVIENRIIVLFKGNKRNRIGEGKWKRVAYALDLISLQQLAHATIILTKDPRLPENTLRHLIDTEIRIHQHLANNEQIVKLFNTYTYPGKKRGAGEEKLAMILEYCNQGELFDAVYNLSEEYEPAHLFKNSLLNTLTVLDDFFAGLATFQDNNIVYRDIKLENILLTFQKGKLRLKFTDFGLSDFIENEKNEMRQKSIARGTLTYSCPYYLSNAFKHQKIHKQSRLEKMCGHQSDIWSAGVVLHIILTEYLVPVPENAQSVLNCDQTNLSNCLREMTHISRAFPCLQLAPKTHEILCEMLVGMLQLNPNNRLTGEQLMEMWQAHREQIPEEEITAIDQRLENNEYIKLEPAPLPKPVVPNSMTYCSTH